VPASSQAADASPTPGHHLESSPSLEPCAERQLEDNWFYLRLHTSGRPPPGQDSGRTGCGEPLTIHLVDAEYRRMSTEYIDASASEACFIIRVPESLRPPVVVVDTPDCYSQTIRYPDWLLCRNAASPCTYRLEGLEMAAPPISPPPPGSHHLFPSPMVVWALCLFLALLIVIALTLRRRK